jgi:hypothetical protein
MINGWRQFPARPAQQQEPQPEPHIWDKVTQEQNASMNENADKVMTIVQGLVQGLPPEQQSTLKNYNATRTNSGREAKVP